jgi:hypothetical protein
MIYFGVLGSTLWFLIPWLMGMVLMRFFPNVKRVVRVLVIVIAIPAILVGFFMLSTFSMKLRIKNERPSELKKVLNSASSEYLTEKIIFAEDNRGSINSIKRVNCKGVNDQEIAIALTGGVVFLDENYRQQSWQSFGGLGFNKIETINADDSSSCEFLAYNYSKGVFLFDLEGKEKWKVVHNNTGTGHIDGVDFGDVDGDGKTEFAIYHRYREGIHLVDSDGQTRWKHPVHSLGHLEIIDIDGDGKAEIIYSNGTTEFNILDEAASIVDQLKIDTRSCAFATVKWPKNESEPCLLLTEDSKIRIVDLKGNVVIALDAPGCRTFGKVKASTVKFRKDEPEYLAVRKSLHPDLSVLYVYDHGGKLVYQKTEVTGGGGYPTISAIPKNETGNEVLLVGSVRDDKPVVLEYSLKR